MKNTVHWLIMGGLLLLLVLTFASNPWPPRNAEGQTTESDTKKVEIDVPVRGTFLRALDMWPYKGPGTYKYDEDLEMNIETSGLYRVERPAIVDLEAKGFAENEKIVIRYTADVDGTGAWGGSVPSYLWKDGDAPVLALFSATPDLKPIGDLHRVPGAIDFGWDFKTDHTWWDDDCESVANAAATKGIVVDRGEETDIPEDFLIYPYSGMKLQIPEGAKYLFLCLYEVYYPDDTGVVTLTIENATGIEDGYDHRLGGVEVTLLAPSAGGPTTVAVTLTDDEGGYSFSGVDEGDYQIEVALEHHKEVGDTATFSVNYDTGPAVSAQTDTFHTAGGTVARDISFADPDLIPASGIPRDRLDDLALMYYHTKQAVDFEQTELGVTPDLTLPIEVHAYKHGSDKVFYSSGDITIGDAVSGYSDPDRPMNREWHEMFHELMDDTMGMPPRHTGDNSHGGFVNHCTGNSWVEGWAEFWSCVLKRSLDDPGWRVYDWAGGNTNLEYIWRVWDDEEFAVASLLVDIADPVDPADGDYISLTNSQLWAIIGSQSLTDMNGVYSALVAANVGQLDTDADGITDLDELFIVHGFYADSGNKQYDAGEVVGLGGKPGRTDRVPIPDTSIRILVADSQGNPVDAGTLLVDVTFPSPMDIYNYSYEVSLSGSDSQVGFYVAPDGDDALMTMRVRDGSGVLSDELAVSNSLYWDRVSEATEGYAAEHTFVIGAEGKTTTVGASGATSGGVPVWSWPIVGVIAVAAGAGGFLLLRRRVKPG
jgi:hypothetical protein